MTELVLTRGIPGSGKTTWAKAWVAEDPAGRARVNRDDLRLNMYGRPAPLDHGLEVAVTAAQHAAVRSLLQRGTSVVVDDTNLRLAYVKGYAEIARDCGAEIRLQDFDTDLRTCIERDGIRDATVGEEVVRQMHSRWQSAKRHGLADLEVDEPYAYEPDPSLPFAWLFDVDGTLARMDGRSPYDWSRVGEDEIVPAVRHLFIALRQTPIAGRSPGTMIVLSGRDEVCRQETTVWLYRHQINFAELHMRPEGDRRRDSVVKLEIFREQIAPRYNVLGVFDDRNQVVDMWRRIGLFCAQVAPGDF